MSRLHLNEFSAWITVDNQEVPVYQPQTPEDGKAAIGWIASKDGQKFSISWKDISRATCTEGTVTLDGFNCGGKVIKDKATDRQAKETATKGTVRASFDKVRPFQFSALKLTDDEDALTVSDVSRDFGTIVLKINRVIIRGYGSRPRIHSDIPDNLVFHESSKKAGMHRCGFGHSKKDKAKRTIRTKHIDHEPVATFIFKYKPLDVLVADGIAKSHRSQMAHDVSEGTARPPALLVSSSSASKREKKRKIKTETTADASDVVHYISDDEDDVASSVSHVGKKHKPSNGEFQTAKSKITGNNHTVKKEPQLRYNNEVIDLT